MKLVLLKFIRPQQHSISHKNFIEQVTMERYNLRDRNIKMSPTVTSTIATSCISTPTEVIYLGLENIEGGWLADQAARDAARLSTEDAPIRVWFRDRGYCNSDRDA